jgi:GNAT superfamily N-acetyltransferase
MRGRILIRDALPADAPGVAELLTELGYPLDTAGAAERLARGIEAVFVAAEGTRILGLLAVWSQLPIARARPVARVTAMVVRSQARRRGVGKLLMERALEWAQAAGCEGVELTSGIHADREDAHRFYESLGFQKTSYRFWLPLGR